VMIFLVIEVVTKNVSVIENEQFCDEIAWFVMVRQMWRVVYEDFKIVINSSQKVFNDEFSLFRDESVLSLMWTLVLVWQPLDSVIDGIHGWGLCCPLDPPQSFRMAHLVGSLNAKVGLGKGTPSLPCYLRWLLNYINT
jgi:hypothetical protein